VVISCIAYLLPRLSGIRLNLHLTSKELQLIVMRTIIFVNQRTYHCKSTDHLIM